MSTFPIRAATLAKVRQRNTNSARLLPKNLFLPYVLQSLSSLSKSGFENSQGTDIRQPDSSTTLIKQFVSSRGKYTRIHKTTKRCRLKGFIILGERSDLPRICEFSQPSQIP